MAMNKIPTLILGIGGIGCQIAAGVSDLLSEEDRKYVGIVGLDTNVNDLAKLQKRRIKTIQTSDNRVVRDYLVEHPEYKSWFPVSRFLVDRGMLDGAGQVRPISRLAAIAAEENGMFLPIEEEIKRIRANDGEGARNTLTVMIVGSITGGTGAGLFLQLPFYIRQHMKHTDGIDAIIIRGMFVGADITAPVQPSTINKKAVRVNAYACLKELNAFYMTQHDSELEGKLNVEWYEKRSAAERDLIIRKIKTKEDTALPLDEDDLEMNAGYGGDAVHDDEILSEGNANIPYNYLYLIEGSNASGGIGEASIGSVISQVSRIVFTYLFTPVSGNALSVEDNFVLQDMAEGGMNRYASAGMCRLIYPKELAEEYVTLCATRNLVRDEWMQIDRDFRQEIVTARGQMATDPSIELPKLETSFPGLFREAVENGKLTRLYKEAFVELEDHTVEPRIEGFLNAITEMVTARIADEDVKLAESMCELNQDAMRSVETAQTEVSRVYDALDSYERLAKKVVSTGSARIANELFPPSWDGMAGSKDKPNCIYQWLNKVHPLTGRFFCYEIINRLEAVVEEEESRAAGINLNIIDEEDFDPKTEGKQSAATAISGLEDRRNWLQSALDRAGANVDAKKLSRIKRQLQDNVVEYQKMQLAMYLESNLTLNVSRQILLRVRALVKNYESFFAGISGTIAENERRIEELETNRMLPLGQKGVYCSREALRTMAYEYENLGRSELPTETCKAVFEQLFRVFADDFSLSGKQLTELGQQRRDEERKRDLDGIFTNAVFSTIRDEVRKNGSAIIDMTVLEALNRQMELETGITRNSADYDKKSVDYIRDQIGGALRMAAPMLAVDAATLANNTETVYVALNPRCAVLRESKPDASATQETYVPKAGEVTDGVAPTLLMDEEFSPYEITCLKARYKFLIEELIKYKPGAENARAYKERIANLNGKVDGNDPDAYKTVVNPHLNRFWHEEAFLPAISPLERVKDREDCMKAFIYGLGFDLFTRRVDDEHLDERGKGRLLWYVNLGRGSTQVKRCRQFIGNEFSDLYQAIPYNGLMKRTILSYAQQYARHAKGHREASELFDGILDDVLVQDLCQVSPNNSMDVEMNIFDVFRKMRDQMDLPEWQELFGGLLQVLQEYSARLFDGNERMVIQATRKILERIYEGCSTAKMKPEEKKSVDLSLEEQYQRILQEASRY